MEGCIVEVLTKTAVSVASNLAMGVLRWAGRWFVASVRKVYQRRAAVERDIEAATPVFEENDHPVPVVITHA